MEQPKKALPRLHTVKKISPIFKEKIVNIVKGICYSHTQAGHEPDLMRVKMGGNSPGIDGNLDTVRVETARYGFCIRI
jgi:hypothetical protein